MNNKNSTSNSEVSSKREVELDLLQRRFNNKTRRAIRAIQFNLVALTAVIGIIQFGASSDFRIDGLFLVGGGLLMLSGLFSFIGVALNGSPLPIERDDSANFDPAALANEYRLRNWYLGKLMIGALVAGGTGIMVLALRSLELTEVDRALPLLKTAIVIVILLLGAVAVGRYLATS